MKKLKLSKTSWISLSVGIFVVAVGSLGFTYSKQLEEQAQADDKLGVAEMRIDKFQIKQLRQQQTELQEKLDESFVQLAAAKDSLRQPVESIDVTDEFYAIAYSCGVVVTRVSSSGVKNEKLGSVTCSVMKINAVVIGEVSDLISFVTKLNNDLTTGIVQSVKMSITGEIDTEEADTEETDTEETDTEETDTEETDEGRSTANIVMVVYAYEGD